MAFDGKQTAEEGAQYDESRAKGFLSRVRGAFIEWFHYFAEAVVAVFFLFLISTRSAQFETWQFCLCWVALSVLATFGFVYMFMLRKMMRQPVLQDGGELSRLNNGRMLTILVSFILAAISVLGILVESVRWSTEWSIVFLAVVVYPIAFHFLQSRISKELTERYRRCATMRVTSVFVFILLAALFVVFAIADSILGGGFASDFPADSFSSISDVYRSMVASASESPFKDSPSNLVKLIGQAYGLSGALSSYLLDEVSGSYGFLGAISAAITYGLSLAGISALLNFCALGLPEIRAVFLSIDDILNEEEKPKPRRRFIAAFVVLPIVLFACCMYANSCITKDSVDKVSNETYAFLQILDDTESKYEESVSNNSGGSSEQGESLEDQLRRNEKEATDSAKQQIKSSISLLYECRRDKVDQYLDWYFSPCGVYVREQWAQAGEEDASKTARNDILDSGATYKVSEAIKALVGASDSIDIASLKPDLNPADYLRCSIQGKIEESQKRESLRSELLGEIDREEEEALQKVDDISDEEDILKLVGLSS